MFVKYKIGDKIQFVFVFYKIPCKFTGEIISIKNEFAVKLDNPVNTNGILTSILNINKKDIICKMK